MQEPSPSPSEPSALAAFAVRSFRFQFGADLALAWAVEMEVLILGWYVLTSTDSPFLLALIGALRFGGTLISPLVGAFADRVSRKRMLLGIRTSFAALALVVMVLSLGGWLAPWHVFAVVTCTGLLRPADMMLRQSLIADTVPRALLTNAMGFSRMTIDSARIVGALAGAGAMATLGMGRAYIIVAVCYGVSLLLTVRVEDRTREAAGHTGAIAELLAGFAFLRTSPSIQNILILAFLVNLTVLSITGGLLPLVARDVYGLGSSGLGLMVATYAGGALLGSIVTTAGRGRRPERTMLVSTIVWHVLMVCFAQVHSAGLGIALLGIIGFVSSFSMVPMSAALLLAIPAAYRARIMGVRQLAVFGLPLGLLASGALIEWTGIAVTFSLYGVLGLAVTAWVWWRWVLLGHSSGL